MFISGGLETGSYADPAAAEGNTSVHMVNACSEVIRRWALDLDPTRHLFGSRVVEVDGGWLVAGAMCDVLIASEGPGGCTGGVPQMWQLLEDGTTESISLDGARSKQGDDVGTGIVTLYGQVPGGVLVGVQFRDFVDTSTSTVHLYLVDLRSGGVEALSLPAPLLTPGQLCLRPNGILWFAEPVVEGTTPGHQGARFHSGTFDGSTLRWSEDGGFDVDVAFGTSPQFSCTEDIGVMTSPSTSDIYTFDVAGRLLRHEDLRSRFVGFSQVDEAVYVSTRQRADDSFDFDFMRIDVDGSMEQVGSRPGGDGQLPILVRLGEQLYDAGTLVAFGQPVPTDPRLAEIGR